MLESVKESDYVSKYNRTGELSLENIKMIFSPVHQSSPVIVDYRFEGNSVCFGPVSYVH